MPTKGPRELATAAASLSSAYKGEMCCTEVKETEGGGSARQTRTSARAEGLAHWHWAASQTWPLNAFNRIIDVHYKL